MGARPESDRVAIDVRVELQMEIISVAEIRCAWRVTKRRQCMLNVEYYSEPPINTVVFIERIPWRPQMRSQRSRQNSSEGKVFHNIRSARGGRSQLAQLLLRIDAVEQPTKATSIGSNARCDGFHLV